MIRTILITGASGFIGSKLVDHLLKLGYTINVLSRKGKGHSDPRVRSFEWDVYNRQVDEKCIQNVDAIIHLAGEDIAGKRWTPDRKKQIIESRTESIRLIYKILEKYPHGVEHIISASAIGFYGDRKEEILNEDSLPGNDFLADTCVAWEGAVKEGSALDLRTVLLRTGVVLDKSGGAFPAMIKPLNFGLGIIPGNGKQWVPWIHLEDVIRIYQFALEHENLRGAYNMTAPGTVRLETLIKGSAEVKGKKPIIKTPALAIKVALGEMSELVLSSTRVSSDKITRAGYQFVYPHLIPALSNILS